MSQDATKDLIESLRDNKTAFAGLKLEISRLKKELREKQNANHNYLTRTGLHVGDFELCEHSECIRIREMTVEATQIKDSKDSCC